MCCPSFELAGTARSALFLILSCSITTQRSSSEVLVSAEVTSLNWDLGVELAISCWTEGELRKLLTTVEWELLGWEEEVVVVEGVIWRVVCVVVAKLIEVLLFFEERDSGFCGGFCLIIVLSGSLMLRPVGFLSASLEDKVGAVFVVIVAVVAEVDDFSS